MAAFGRASLALGLVAIEEALAEFAFRDRDAAVLYLADSITTAPAFGKDLAKTIPR